MNSDSCRFDVQGELSQLEKSLASEHASRKKVTRAVQIVTALLTCTTLFFVLVNYIHFHNHWTEENFRNSLQKEFSELKPVAMKEIHAAGKELLPVYAQEGQRQLNLLMPEIARTMRIELNKFCVDVLAQTHEKLQDGQERILAQSEKVLFAHYPSLKDPEKLEELHRRFAMVTQGAVHASLVEFDRLFSSDLEVVKSTLLKFDLKDNQETPVELQKKFLRLWLQLLDEEIKDL